VKFGICSNPAQAELMNDIGADFIEWNVSANVGTASDAEYASLVKTTGRLSLRPEAWNVLLPGEIMVVGPEANPDELRTYAERALPRVRQLGGEVIVFGSGRSRTVPEEWSAETAQEQFATACRIVAEIAHANDLVIVLEPLRRQETNLITRVDEGLRLVERLDQPGFELLADMYHMAAEDEPFANLIEAAPRLRHVHIAAPDSRGVPLEPEATTVLGEFFRTLRKTGYDARISFECKWEDPEDLATGLTIARELWEQSA
jgi:sugar phosphate isomerase/epimerase